MAEGTNPIPSYIFTSKEMPDKQLTSRDFFLQNTDQFHILPKCHQSCLTINTLKLTC